MAHTAGYAVTPQHNRAVETFGDAVQALAAAPTTRPYLVGAQEPKPSAEDRESCDCRESLVVRLYGVACQSRNADRQWRERHHKIADPDARAPASLAAAGFAGCAAGGAFAGLFDGEVAAG